MKLSRTLILCFLVALVSTAYAELKDKIKIYGLYKNEECALKGADYKIISEADAPVWVRIKLVQDGSPGRKAFQKFRIEPGEEICCYHPKTLREGRMTYRPVVGVWYAKDD